MPHFFFFLLFALLMISEGGSRDIAATPPQAGATPGEAVTLARSTPVEITGENIAVTFEEVLTDGRCPAQMLDGSDRPVMMQCTASLPVEIAIGVRRGDTVEHLTLSAHTDTEGNVTPGASGASPSQLSGAHIIALEQVLPYPMVDTPRNDDAYTVTLRVTRSAAAGPVTQAPASIPATLGEPVTLHISQTAIVNPGGVKVTVASITDQRCPAMTICDAIPIVVVDLHVQVNDQTSRKSVGGVTNKSGHVTGPLMETSGIPWAQVGDYTLELTDVTPYPQPRVETAPGDYAVTLVVTAIDRGKPTPASPTASPAPTAVPTPAPTSASDIPVLSFDAAGNALLCVSERALVELAAGANDAAPVAGTPLPLGAVSLVSEAAADEICGMFFGDGWRVATVDDLTMSYAAYLPREGVFWVWDTTADAAVAWEAGQ